PGAARRGGIAVCGTGGRCAGATCAGGAARVMPGGMRTVGAGCALTVGGAGRRSRCGSGTVVAGGVPGWPISAGDGERGGAPGGSGERGGCASGEPGTAIGRATPGGGTCVRTGSVLKVLRTVGSTCATIGATGRCGTNDVDGTTLTALGTRWLL